MITKDFTYRFLAMLGLAIVLIALPACSSNKAAVPLQSHPNEVSTYLFSAGDVMFFSRDFAGATELYRMSANFDTNAFTIKRSIYNSLVLRVLNNQIPVEEFEGYADTLFTEQMLDKEMLEQAYNIYLQAGKLQKARQILSVYFKKYKSSRAYTSLFYIQEQMEGVKDIKLLDKARALAGSDADFLNSLGFLYTLYDSTRAEKTWQLARQYDTTANSTINLWNFYAARQDVPALKKLYASFLPTGDIERQTSTLEQVLKTGNFSSVTAIYPQILASGQPTQVLVLLQASWYSNQDDIFQLALTKLGSLQLTNPQIQVMSAFSACWLLKSDNPQALNAIAALDGKNSLDEFVQLYRAYNDGFFEKAAKATETNVLPRLNRLLLKAAPDSVPIPVRDYLVMMTDSLAVNIDFAAPDSVALPCVQFFFDQNRKTYDTYVWLAQYYNREKQYDAQIAVLIEALGTFPEDAALLNWLGYTYIIRNEHLDESESLVRRALQLAPENPYYLDSLGWLMYLKGDYTEAIRLMEIPQALEKLPSEIAWHIASIYLALDDYDNAKLFTKRALESNDDQEFVRKAEELLKTMP